MSAAIPVRLRVVGPDGVPVTRDLTSEPFIIGRSSRAHISLPDPALSREHARLIPTGDGWEVEDLGSRNGSFLNGARISGRLVLGVGDVLSLGSSTLTLETSAPRPAGGMDEETGGHTVFMPASELLRHSGVTVPVTSGDDAGDLRRLAERLRVLNQVHQALAAPINEEELLDLILERAFDQLHPEQGAVYLREGPGEFRRAAYRSVAGAEQGLRFSNSLAREVVDKGMAALVLDAQEDQRFAAAVSLLNVGVRSLVAAPLLDREGSLGMIVLSSRLTVRQFSEEDLELLVSLAAVAALRLRNVALAREASERRRLEQEVALARRIQLALLPRTIPAPQGYEILGRNAPSRGVSGDYYAVRERHGGREWVLLVADVSGKGVGASLLTASLEALSAAPIEDGLPPEEVCRRVSGWLYDRTPPEKYATVFLAVLEVASGRLRYASAGHNPALLVRAEGSEWLGSTGPPLGILPEASYEVGEVILGPGDLVAAYTDGLTEAADPDEEQFGENRLAEVLVRHRHEPLPRVAESLEAAIDAFVRGEPYADDRTLLMLRRLL